MSDTSSDSDEATEQTALMDGHIAEARPDREIAERIARKRKTKTEGQRTYGVSTTFTITPHETEDTSFVLLLLITHHLTPTWSCYLGQIKAFCSDNDSFVD